MSEVELLKEFLKREGITRFHVTVSLDPMNPEGYSDRSIDQMPEKVAKEYRESMERVAAGHYTEARFWDSPSEKHSEFYKMSWEFWQKIKMYARIAYRKTKKLVS